MHFREKEGILSTLGPPAPGSRTGCTSARGGFGGVEGLGFRGALRIYSLHTRGEGSGINNYRLGFTGVLKQLPPLGPLQDSRYSPTAGS